MMDGKGESDTFTAANKMQIKIKLTWNNHFFASGETPILYSSNLKSKQAFLPSLPSLSPRVMRTTSVKVVQFAKRVAGTCFKMS